MCSLAPELDPRDVSTCRLRYVLVFHVIIAFPLGEDAVILHVYSSLASLSLPSLELAELVLDILEGVEPLLVLRE